MIGESKLKSCGRKNLADDGNRDWDDGLCGWLGKEYPDWKDLQRTYMVPPSFKSKGTEAKGARAEKTMYDNLQELGEANNEPMFVVHSFEYSEHIPDSERKKSWVMGESDFVVIHRKHGLIFFQVKATEDGHKYKEAEEQIRKDKRELENLAKKLEKRMLKEKQVSANKITEVFKNFPGFVVMPNCQRGQSKCTRGNALYQEDSSSEAFSIWWRDNIVNSRHPPLDKTIFEHLVMWFVGLTHIGPCLSYSIDESHKDLVFRTREQLKVLLKLSPEQWITGPGGSGKTWVLMEKVKKLAEKALLRDTTEKILVACYNKPLSVMLLKTFEQHLVNSLQDGELSSVLEVKTFDKLLCGITGSKLGDSDQEKEEHVATAITRLENYPSSIEHYDHIFVDECQDLCGDKWPILFKKLLKDAPNADDEDEDDDEGEPKHIWFLYDTNQYLRSSEQQLRHHRKTLKKSTRLSVVLRNTENIFQQSRKYFKSPVTGDLTLGHRETGLAIKWDGSLRSTAVTEREGAQAILKRIGELREHKVQERDICILVRNTEIRDRLSSELRRLGVETQDAEKLYEENESKVILESIWRFKGLESKVIVLYNPPFCEVKDWSVRRTNEILYTAVSRCFCYLVIITTRLGCKALQSKEGIQTRDDKTSVASQLQTRTGLHNSKDLESERRSQVDALFKKSFGKRALETQYQSGPYEYPSKRDTQNDDDDGDDKDEAHFSPPKVSRMEKAKMHQQHKMFSNVASEQRPTKIPGCKLLEPGDHYIKDSIRNNAFDLLSESVKQNLQYVPTCSSNSMNQSSRDVTSAVVAQIEYEVYCQKRNECNPRNYTKYLRELKRDVEDCNRKQTSHEVVARAYRNSS